MSRFSLVRLDSFVHVSIPSCMSRFVSINLSLSFVSTCAALAVSLGGNFVGITTKLLETNVPGARSARL